MISGLEVSHNKSESRAEILAGDYQDWLSFARVDPLQPFP